MPETGPFTRGSGPRALVLESCLRFHCLVVEMVDTRGTHRYPFTGGARVGAISPWLNGSQAHLAGSSPAQTTMNEKIKCSCGYMTEYRCRIHPARPAHIHWGNGWWCHECETYIHEQQRLGVSSDVSQLRLLEKQFVLCPGCAHEQALIEDSERELETFLSQPPRLEDLEERLV